MCKVMINSDVFVKVTANSTEALQYLFLQQIITYYHPVSMPRRKPENDKFK